jgi:[ribosomal protein S5]-alanine N-acetyltransferase
MSEPVELKTERLLLRPFRTTDAEDVFAYHQDPQWSLHFGTGTDAPYRLWNAEEYVAGRLLAPWSTDASFAIVLDGSVVGEVTLETKEPHTIADIGYSLARTLWGNGLMTEAARAAIDWGFTNRATWQKVMATANLPNPGSWRVMEKLGMTREGVLRNEGELQGQPVDVVYYGLLREEWEAGRFG